MSEKTLFGRILTRIAKIFDWDRGHENLSEKIEKIILEESRHEMFSGSVLEAAERILKLAEKATEGPWKDAGDGIVSVGGSEKHKERQLYIQKDPTGAITTGKGERRNNRAFITACRTLAPLLARAVTGRKEGDKEARE